MTALDQRCPPDHICFVVPWGRDKSTYLPVDFGLPDPFLPYNPTLKEVLDAIRALFANNKDCRDLFKDIDLTKLLDGIEKGTSAIASVGWGVLPSTRGGVTRIKGHGASSSVDTRTGKVDEVPATWHAEITLNNSIQRDLKDIARTLIHELGHAVNEVLGNGHSKIEFDATDSEWGKEASQRNHQLVKRSCKK